MFVLNLVQASGTGPNPLHDLRTGRMSDGVFLQVRGDPEISMIRSRPIRKLATNLRLSTGPHLAPRNGRGRRCRAWSNSLEAEDVAGLPASHRRPNAIATVLGRDHMTNQAETNIFRNCFILKEADVHRQPIQPEPESEFAIKQPCAQLFAIDDAAEAYGHARQVCREQ